MWERTAPVVKSKHESYFDGQWRSILLPNRSSLPIPLITWQSSKGDGRRQQRTAHMPRRVAWGGACNTHRTAFSMLVTATQATVWNPFNVTYYLLRNISGCFVNPIFPLVLFSCFSSLSSLSMYWIDMIWWFFQLFLFISRIIYNWVEFELVVQLVSCCCLPYETSFSLSM